MESNFIPLLKSGEPMSDEAVSWVPAALKLMRRCLELSLVDTDGTSILEPIYEESAYQAKVRTALCIDCESTWIYTGTALALHWHSLELETVCVEMCMHRMRLI
jgi:hypothetical protein